MNKRLKKQHLSSQSLREKMVQRLNEKKTKHIIMKRNSRPEEIKKKQNKTNKNVKISQFCNCKYFQVPRVV